MMKSVILLLMILGVGGWVLSHSASYIAHRRAAHGPLTRDFFHGNSEIPPAFRQALEETIGTLFSALLVAAVVLSVVMIGLREPILRLIQTPGALPLSGSEAAQLTHFLLAALQVYYRGAPEVTSAGPRCLRADFSPLHGTPEH